MYQLPSLFELLFINQYLLYHLSVHLCRLIRKERSITMNWIVLTSRVVSLPISAMSASSSSLALDTWTSYVWSFSYFAFSFLFLFCFKCCQCLCHHLGCRAFARLHVPLNLGNMLLEPIDTTLQFMHTKIAFSSYLILWPARTISLLPSYFIWWMRWTWGCILRMCPNSTCWLGSSRDWTPWRTPPYNKRATIWDKIRKASLIIND